MELAAAIAATPALSDSPRLLSAASPNAAVMDVAGVAPTDAIRAETNAASTTSRDRTFERAEEQVIEEHDLLRRLTAEDFAAIQDQLGLRLREQDEDEGIPGDIHPEDLTEVALVDDKAQLTIRERVERTADDLEEQHTQAQQRPDFSEAVADAVVTIDEYLAWVNEAGGQPR